MKIKNCMWYEREKYYPARPPTISEGKRIPIGALANVSAFLPHKVAEWSSETFIHFIMKVDTVSRDLGCSIDEAQEAIDNNQVEFDLETNRYYLRSSN